MEVSLIENLQREDLNAIEAAQGIKQLIDRYSLTQEEISQTIGKSRPAIANLLRLLSLPQEILAMVKQSTLSEGHARCLVGLEREKAVYLAMQAVEKNLSVRELERLVKFTAKAKVKKGLPPQSNFEQSSEVKSLIGDMQRVFGTKVVLSGTSQKGRIYIDYYSYDDIERIYDIIEKMKNT